MPRSKLAPLDVYRQSTLAGFTTCARRTRFALEAGDDSTTGWVGSTGHLGQAFHAFAAEYLRTIWHQGATQMSTQEAVEVAYEQLRLLPFALPHADLRELVGMVVGFCAIEWPIDRYSPETIERRLEMPVECEDGQTRVLKGQPDLVMLDPPDALVIVDYKTGRGRVKGPRQEPKAGEIVEGHQYLSDRGHFQGDTYSLLALNEWPAAQIVRFREVYIRSGQIRQMSLSREHLEHVRRRLSLTMELLDRAIEEGPKSELWRPRPGSHCGRKCPVSASCPVPPAMRGAGVIDSVPKANRAAQRLARINGERETLTEALKAWENDPEHPHADVNEFEQYRWGPHDDARLAKGNGRTFGIHPTARAA
jgi:hypothetical protein